MSTTGGDGTRWFYVREGKRNGPIEVTNLVDLVLGGEVAEDALVWHSGLPDWLPAREIEEIRRELPPPLPSPSSAHPSDRVPVAVEEAGVEPPAEPAAWEGPGDPPEPSDAPDAEGSESGLKRRRKRKHRHRDSKRRPTWLWPLVVILVGLMIFLWWLLRRMNEVPPGRIIQTGALHAKPGGLPRPPEASGSRWAGSRGSAPALLPFRPA